MDRLGSLLQVSEWCKEVYNLLWVCIKHSIICSNFYECLWMFSGYHKVCKMDFSFQVVLGNGTQGEIYSHVMASNSISQIVDYTASYQKSHCCESPEWEVYPTLFYNWQYNEDPFYYKIWSLKKSWNIFSVISIKSPY